MKKLSIPLILILLGCAVQPQHYDSIVEMTHTQAQQDHIKFIKQVRGHHDSDLFDTHKMLAKVFKQSAGLLVINNDFLRKLKANFTKK